MKRKVYHLAKVITLMDSIIKSFRRLNSQEILSLEEKLKETFYPITPRKEFVENLNNRLMATSFEPDRVRLKNETQNRFVFVSGFIGGLLIILTGIRAIISITGGISLLLHHYRKNMNIKKVQSPTIVQALN